MFINREKEKDMKRKKSEGKKSTKNDKKYGKECESISESI